MNTEAAARSRRLSAFQLSASHRAMSSGASGPSSPFRVAMDVFANLSALSDEDLKAGGQSNADGSDSDRYAFYLGDANKYTCRGQGKGPDWGDARHHDDADARFDDANGQRPGTMTAQPSSSPAPVAKEPRTMTSLRSPPSPERQLTPTARREGACRNKEDVSAMLGSLDEIAARLESIQDRPELVCKRKARRRGGRATASEVARSLWLAIYGYSNFTRAHDDGTHVL